ncbi:hypothetical protein RHGRI_034445 [Rhododendron griersonianum]|uniref:Uncharacterized protein n=1 Tax=Rhododendron griersonianum TaxID=479676 RepID=A0AAV6I1I5_9ERIC|nr:hypothetical protein RHGRI_034445 [Rhododendron griersonianum]
MDCNGCKDVDRVKIQRKIRRSKVIRGSVRMKVKKLQRLIPGGRSAEPDRLFLMTADYILHLKSQLNVLRALSQAYKP